MNKTSKLTFSDNSRLCHRLS